MKKSCKFCWLISTVLVLALAFSAYTFLIRGDVTTADDGRTEILLSPGERNYVLGEMRSMLEAVQSVTEGLATGDMELVAQSASAVGMAQAGGASPSLVAKLPLTFKKNGFAAHAAFDDLAQSARETGSIDQVLAGLSDILGACTACHAEYRIALQSQ